MTTPYKIPLQSGPQSLIVAMNSVKYQLTIKWNNASNIWVIDIADNSGNPIISGIPMVTGVDLLAQYKYLNFGVKLEVQTNNDTFETPTFNNLGTNGNLYMLVS